MRPWTPPRYLALRAGLAGLFLTLERLWPRLWPAAAALAGFFALGLFGVWQAAPALLHGLIVLALLGYLLRSFWRIATGFKTPSLAARLRRLAVDGGDGSALLALGDRPAGADEFAAALWRAHVLALAPAAGRVRLRLPRLCWLGVDPWGLRHLLGLVLLVGAVAAGDAAPTRLVESLLPNPGAAPPGAAMEAWVTPPAYTGLAPKILSGEPNRIAAGSRLDLFAEGGSFTPRLHGLGLLRRFTASDGDRYRLRLVVDDVEATELRVRQGLGLRGRWPIAVVADLAPVADFPTPPEPSLSQALAIAWRVADDYGVTALDLLIDGPAADRRPPLRLGLALPAMAHGEPVEFMSYQDLTAHPWAGEVVTLMLEAKDALGQVGRSSSLAVALPEREFHHPLARLLIGLRKRLFADPDARDGPLAALDGIARHPEAFDHRLSLFVALRDAHWRLRHDESAEAADHAAVMLWQVAVALEDGGNARDTLRDAMDQAMRELAEKGDVDAALAALRRQIGKFLQQTARAAPDAAIGTGAVINGDILERMLQQIRDLAAAGDQTGAMRMLAGLRAMMENITNGPDPAMLARVEAAQAAARQLDGAAKEQRELLGDTAREAMVGRGMAGSQGPGGDLETRQGELGAALQGIEDQMAKAGVAAPDGVGDARRAMADAQARLGEGALGPAVRDQAAALASLTQALGALQSQVEAAMQAIRAGQGGADPLGRPSGANGLPATEGVTVPDAADFARSRAILDELRRRAGDPGRRAVEREYLQRLIEQF